MTAKVWWMISSEMPELLGMCDRIYVMKRRAVLLVSLDKAVRAKEKIMSMDSESVNGAK